MQPARSLQQFARAGAVCRANQAISLHEIDEVRGAAIPDSKPPLQQRSRGFAKFKNQTYCVVEEGVALVGVAIGALDIGSFVAGRLEEALDRKSTRLNS